MSAHAERESRAAGNVTDLSRVDETSDSSDDGVAASTTVAEMLTIVDEIIQTASTSAVEAANRWARLSPALSSKASSSKAIREKIAACLPLLESWFGNDDEKVKQAACEALDASAEAELPGLELFADKFIPLLLQLLSVEALHDPAFSALISLIDSLPPQVAAAHVTVVVERVLQHLSTVPADEAEIYVEALGTIALSAETGFAPVLAQAIQPLIAIQARGGAEEISSLRVAVQETLSALVESVGKEPFRPFLQATLATAVAQASAKSPPETPVKGGDDDNDNGVDEEDDETEQYIIALRCASFDFFASVAKVYGAEIADALPSICPILLETIERDEEAEFVAALEREEEEADSNSDEAAGAVTVAKTDGESDEDYVDVGEDDDSDDHSLGGLMSFETDQGHAIAAAVEIFGAAKQAFAPYVERVGLALLKQVKSEGDIDVVLAAAQGLLKALEILQEMSGAAKWENGAPVVPFCAEAQQLLSVAMPKILELLDESAEEESELDSSLPDLCISLRETLDTLGPAVLTGEQVESVCETIKMVLEQHSPLVDEKDEAGPGAVSLVERISGGFSLVDVDGLRAVVDLLGTLTSVYGLSIAPFVQKTLPHILRSASPGRSPSERCIALSCLAELAAGLGSGVTPFTQQITATIAVCLDKEQDVAVRTNAIYALGCLVQKSDDPILLQSQSLCEALSKVEDAFKRDDLEHNDVLGDNACSLVARILLKDEKFLPLEQLGPVWLSALPVRVDFEESEVIISALDKLIRAENPIVVSSLSQILSFFVVVLTSTQFGVFPASESAQISQKGKETILTLVKDLMAGPQAAAVQAAGLTVFLN